jgi:hypothetical protein
MYKEKIVTDTVCTHLPNLFLNIRDLLLDKVCEDVMKDAPSVRDLSRRFRSELRIHKMSKHEHFMHVAGVDAGSQVLPLASRRYAVISALTYSLPSGKSYFLEPESFSLPYKIAGEKMHSVVNIRREAKLFETAHRFLEENGTDLLLIDGPLAFSNWWSMAGTEKDRVRLINAINSLLKTCMEDEVPVVGVVKRPTARYLIYEYGLERETDLSDSFFLLQTLNPGERTDIFSPRSAMRKAVRTSLFMDALGCPIYSFYGRFSREWNIPPLRLDLPAFSLGNIEEIANYCYSTSFWEGIPLPIIRADEEVKITRKFISGVYGDIVTKVNRLTGELSYLTPYWGEGRWMGI